LAEPLVVVDVFELPAAFAKLALGQAMVACSFVSGQRRAQNLGAAVPARRHATAA
jgi:hypothetical protein